jgi:hypothetical protein
MHKKLRETSSRFFTALQFPLSASELIADAFRDAGLEGVSRDERNSYWMNDRDLDRQLQNWTVVSAREALHGAFLFLKEAANEEEAAKMTSEVIEGMKEEHKQGSVPNFAQRVMQGRKPL